MDTVRTELQRKDSKPKESGRWCKQQTDRLTNRDSDSCILTSNTSIHIIQLFNFCSKPRLSGRKVVNLYVRFRAIPSFKTGAGNGNTARRALWAALTTVVCLLSCMQETCRQHDSFQSLQSSDLSYNLTRMWIVSPDLDQHRTATWLMWEKE